MTGYLVGDIAGSVYNKENTYREDIKPFEGISTEYYLKKTKEWRTSKTEALPTNATDRMLAAVKFLLYKNKGTLQEYKDFRDKTSVAVMESYHVKEDRAVMMSFLAVAAHSKDKKEYDSVCETIMDEYKPEDEKFIQECKDYGSKLWDVINTIKTAQNDKEAKDIIDGILGTKEVTDDEMRATASTNGKYQQHKEVNWAYVSKEDRQATNYDILRSTKAAVHALYATEDFQSGLIKAISMGGESSVVGAIYGTLAQMKYGKVPEDLAFKAHESLPEKLVKDLSKFDETCFLSVNKLRELREHFNKEQVLEPGKNAETVREESSFAEEQTQKGKEYIQEFERKDHTYDTVQAITFVDPGMPKIYFESRNPDIDAFLHDPKMNIQDMRGASMKELKDALLERKKILVTKAEGKALYTAIQEYQKGKHTGGTYLIDPCRVPEMRTFYYDNTKDGGKLLTVSGTDCMSVNLDKNIRKKIKSLFKEMCYDVAYEMDLILNELHIERQEPYENYQIAFENAAYPVIGSETLTLYQGENSEGKKSIMGRVSIDSKTGMIRISKDDENAQGYETGLFDNLNIRGDKKFIPVEVFTVSEQEVNMVAKKMSLKDIKSLIEKIVYAYGESLPFDPSPEWAENKERMKEEYRNKPVNKKGQKLDDLNPEQLMQIRYNQMRKELSKYYNIAPLAEVKMIIFDRLHKEPDFREWEAIQEKMDSVKNSPYQYELKPTNIDLIAEDIDNCQDPELLQYLGIEEGYEYSTSKGMKR